MEEVEQCSVCVVLSTMSGRLTCGKDEVCKIAARASLRRAESKTAVISTLGFGWLRQRTRCQCYSVHDRQQRADTADWGHAA